LGSRLTGAEKQDESSPFVGVVAGSLDDPSWFRAQMDIFTSDGSRWDAMDPAIPNTNSYPEKPERENMSKRKSSRQFVWFENPRTTSRGRRSFIRHVGGRYPFPGPSPRYQHNRHRRRTLRRRRLDEAMHKGHTITNYIFVESVEKATKKKRSSAAKSAKTRRLCPVWATSPSSWILRRMSSPFGTDMKREDHAVPVVHVARRKARSFIPVSLARRIRLWRKEFEDRERRPVSEGSP